MTSVTKAALAVSMRRMADEIRSRVQQRPTGQCVSGLFRSIPTYTTNKRSNYTSKKPIEATKLHREADGRSTGVRDFDEFTKCLFFRIQSRLHGAKLRSGRLPFPIDPWLLMSIRNILVRPNSINQSEKDAVQKKFQERLHAQILRQMHKSHSRYTKLTLDLKFSTLHMPSVVCICEDRHRHSPGRLRRTSWSISVQSSLKTAHMPGRSRRFSRRPRILTMNMIARLPTTCSHN